jgi:hypothetical protein
MIMSTINRSRIANFTVRAHRSGRVAVFENEFEKAIAEFDDLATAEKYALQLANFKSSWKVDVYDASGTLVGTYNSEDDAMPKPNLA